MRDIIIYVAPWWEKYLSKRSLLNTPVHDVINLLYYENYVIILPIENVLTFVKSELTIKLSKKI